MINGTCRKHGKLDEGTGFKYISKTSASGFRLRCKQCFDERMKIHREKNKNIPKPKEIKGFCRTHGDLNEETGIICIDNGLPNGYRVRCKECVHKTRVNNYYNKREEKISKIQAWKKDNRERINEQVREDYKNNPEKHKKWRDDHYAKNRDKISLGQSLKERKMSKERYDQMMIEQNGKCKICKQYETRMARDGKTITRLCIDHNHDTNQVRALLCHDCNTALGKMKDCPELLLEAAYYLVDYKGWTT